MSDYHYGLASPQEVVGLSGREILQAIIDGRFSQPPISKTLSFWLVEVGDGLPGFRRRAWRAPAQPDWHGPRRLGADAD